LNPITESLQKDRGWAEWKSFAKSAKQPGDC